MGYLQDQLLEREEQRSACKYRSLFSVLLILDHFLYVCLSGHPVSVEAGLLLEGKKAGLWHPRRASADHSIFQRNHHEGYKGIFPLVTRSEGSLLSPPCGGEPSSSSALVGNADQQKLMR
jgi:hypothetical protein